MDDNFESLFSSTFPSNCCSREHPQYQANEDAGPIAYSPLEHDMLGHVDAEQEFQLLQRELYNAEPDRLTAEDGGPSLAVTPPNECSRLSVIAKIESIFEHQVDILLAQEGSCSVSLKSRPKITSGIDQPTTRDGKHRVYRYPGNSAEEAWRYTVILRLLEMIHEALTCNIVLTKREMYYRDPALFSTQAIVDRYVDELAYTFGVPRSDLNVAATAKGLVVGAYSMLKSDGSSILGNVEREGHLIAGLTWNDRIDTGRVKWILVVEKEATFRSLVESPFWSRISNEGMLVTAKGYPDIFTRAFLRFASSPSASNNYKGCSVYGLFDFDPDGIGILSTYKHGSIKLGHENAQLVCPSMNWIGLKSVDLSPSDDIHLTQGLLRLSERDRRMANRMLSRRPLDEGGQEPVWRREMQVMLMLNIKAEIQLLEAQEGGLRSWLESRSLG